MSALTFRPRLAEVVGPWKTLAKMLARRLVTLYRLNPRATHALLVTQAGCWFGIIFTSSWRGAVVLAFMAGFSWTTFLTTHVLQHVTKIARDLGEWLNDLDDQRQIDALSDRLDDADEDDEE